MTDFKFGIKLKPKTVGDFNVGNPEEWTLLIKPQIKDDTLFVHFHCEFKRDLTDEEKANGVTEPPLAMKVISGFLKEGKFCHVISNNHSAFNKEKLLLIYEKYLKDLYEQGYMKHTEMYLGDLSIEPTYRKYEGVNQSIGGIQAMMSQMMSNVPNTTVASTVKPRPPQFKVLPMKIATVNPNKP